MEANLEKVRDLMRRSVLSSRMRAESLDLKNCLASGKMLRARLALLIGPTVGTSPEIYLRAAAAIEMVHAASLLHDDIVDGSQLRRNSPAFWTKNGVAGAILLGDLLLCEASELLREVGDTRLTDELMSRTTEMCRAEVEQELILRGAPQEWECSLDLARRKTGSLFAFAAFASGVGHTGLSNALREAGYLAGTAYQLSDDYLDAYGAESSSGKTLGLDSIRHKSTAMTATGGGPQRILRQIAASQSLAESNLSEWPAVQQAWMKYWQQELGPALSRNLGNDSKSILLKAMDTVE